jgi:hypothetical protein
MKFSVYRLDNTNNKLFSSLKLQSQLWDPTSILFSHYQGLFPGSKVARA